MHRILRVALLAVAFLVLSLEPFAQTTSPVAQLTVAELKVGGAVATPLSLTIADLQKMPRKTISLVNPHNKKTEVYQGVLLEEVLHRAGVPQGAQLRGPALATYIIAEAEDGYKVVFSLAELDSGILDSDILVADTMDSAPIPPKEGPFRLVAPHDKRPARWVRMLKSLTVARPATP